MCSADQLVGSLYALNLPSLLLIVIIWLYFSTVMCLILSLKSVVNFKNLPVDFVSRNQSLPLAEPSIIHAPMLPCESYVNQWNVAIL